jgi:hypothetical protein
MRKRHGVKAVTNERKYSHIVELVITADGLDVALGRRRSFIIRDTSGRDMDVELLGKAKSIIAGASPIWRPLVPSSNSLAERCAKLAFELGGQVARTR